MAQEYWIYKGDCHHFDDLELNDDGDGMVKSKPCGFYDIVSLSDTIEGGIHVIEYSEYQRIKEENARYREALEAIALAQEQWSLEATLRSFVFELQKRTEIAQRALKGSI